MLIDQGRVTCFAEATNEEQWIHIDEERAKNTLFGGTIVHGYLTLSLIPHLVSELLHIESSSMGINYGIDKLRFPAVLPSGSKIRLHAKLVDAEEKPSGALYRLAAEIEIEGQPKPALAATLLYLAMG